MLLGQLSLNLSCLMYAILYVPQILHNQKQANLDGLSKSMHFLLYGAYSLDLLYGVMVHLPWQYRLVSALGWILLTLQHLQIAHHFKKKQQFSAEYRCYSVLILVVVWMMEGLYEQPFSEASINLAGFIAQFGFGIALLPQILKSKQLQSTNAIHMAYLVLNVSLACLDLISAWQLHWGWPNKVGSSLMFGLTSILLLQRWFYGSSKDHMTNPY
ncbi:MAG: hypothetical protein CK424_00065 [Legionella sp.]|nr:MAG: hypothetical protein CK424_00065 [Legionella sp.]